MSVSRAVHAVAIAEEVKSAITTALSSEIAICHVGHIPVIANAYTERTGESQLRALLPAAMVYVELEANEPMEIGEAANQEQTYAVEVLLTTAWDIADAGSWSDGMKLAERLGTVFVANERLTSTGVVTDTTEPLSPVTLGYISSCRLQSVGHAPGIFSRDNGIIGWRIAATVTMYEVSPATLPA